MHRRILLPSEREIIQKKTKIKYQNREELSNSLGLELTADIISVMDSMQKDLSDMFENPKFNRDALDYYDSLTISEELQPAGDKLEIVNSTEYKNLGLSVKNLSDDFSTKMDFICSKTLLNFKKIQL